MLENFEENRKELKKKKEEDKRKQVTINIKRASSLLASTVVNLKPQKNRKFSSQRLNWITRLLHMLKNRPERRIEGKTLFFMDENNELRDKIA